MEKTYSGSIALTKMKCVIMDKKGKDGNLITGIFLPIELNGLEYSNDAVYLPIRIMTRGEQDKYGQNGFISKNSKPAKPYKEMSEEEKSEHNASNPILGNIKDFGNTKTSSVASVSDDDNMPF